MAVTRTIIKNHRMQHVVQLIATAYADAATITMDELARSDETSSTSITRRADIQYIKFSSTGTATVARGSTSVLMIAGNEEIDFSGIGLSTANGSSLVVTFNAPGMLILDLRKVAGFIEPNTNVGV